MNKNNLKKTSIPDKPGVYFFLKKERILYIGKATSLRNRVRSYFGKDLINTRGVVILDMVTIADDIKWQETDSVLEALILEANLIKKHQPKYNTKEKDNKSFNYVCITRDHIPKVLVIRGRNIKRPLPNLPLNKREEKGGGQYSVIYGPFPNGLQLREAMRIIRKIFPYFDSDSLKKNNKEFYSQLKLTPEHTRDYKNNIKNIKLFFEGKKKRIIVDMKKEMKAFSKSKDFEKAAFVRDQIFALNHINDVSLIKNEISGSPTSRYRIEAYDIAHMAGQNMVGVMTVIEDGELAKNEYRKFIIKTQKGSNDTGALEEVLSRRFRHTEWGLPNMIVVDGSTAQVNIAKQVLSRYQFDIPVLAVVKNEKHKPKAIMGSVELIKKYKREVLLSNNEAHRFAITFHKQKRNKNFIQK